MRIKREFTDFIEKDGPAVRQLETSVAIGDRSGEGAFEVPEQFALDEARRDGAAVHFHERAVLARAAVVDGPGDELLAGASFPRDQHRGINAGNLLDLPQHVE